MSLTNLNAFRTLIDLIVRTARVDYPSTHSEITLLLLRMTDIGLLWTSSFDCEGRKLTSLSELFAVVFSAKVEKRTIGLCYVNV